MDIRKVPGTTLTNPANRKVIYTPPQGEELLRGKLNNWGKFLHDHKAIDPLIRMAVAHYQFEAIHPFTDGNGRTGRIINLLYMVEEKLLSIPVLYLSRFIIQNKADYYRLLREVTEQLAWEPWLLFMLEAVRSTANWLTFTQPYCRIVNLADAGIAKRQTASNYLKELSRIGVLREQQAGRDKLFVHPKLLNLLSQDGNYFHPYSA